MKKDIQLCVKSRIEADGEVDRLEITTKGNLLTRGENVYLSYKETSETGYDGCSVLISLEGNECVTVSRGGDLKSQLVMKKGSRNLCSYKSPYGSTMLGVTCSDIKVKNSGNILSEICLEYALDINSALISNNQLWIKVKELKP